MENEHTPYHSAKMRKQVCEEDSTVLKRGNSMKRPREQKKTRKHLSIKLL